MHSYIFHILTYFTFKYIYIQCKYNDYVQNICYISYKNTKSQSKLIGCNVFIPLLHDRRQCLCLYAPKMPQNLGDGNFEHLKTCMCFLRGEARKVRVSQVYRQKCIINMNKAFNKIPANIGNTACGGIGV